MIPLHLPAGRLSVLALAAHADDIEIGAGGTLLRLDREIDDLRLHYVVLTGDDDRADEAREGATAFAPTANVTVEAHGLPDGRLPAHWSDVKAIMQDLAQRVRPDLILAPSPADAHQDHRLLAELVHQAFRDSLVLQFEIPKWDGDLGASRPTHYVPLTQAEMARKCELLAQHFGSQADHDWFDDETFRGLARLRGMECRAAYAEAFAVPKAVIGFGDASRPAEWFAEHE